MISIKTWSPKANIPVRLKIEAEGGVFVLPSHYEPWGVVVHEFALAGFPLIVSDCVGARSAFVDKRNGIVFKTGNTNELKKAMKYFIHKNEQELQLMGEVSYKKALLTNENKWVKTANTMLNKRDI